MKTPRNICLIATCLFLAPLSHAAEVTAAYPSKPNIIIILADDLGWKDVAYQGSAFCKTPHIDQLAKEGMVFTAGYAGAANCEPSRACLISGEYTPRHGVYAVDSTDRGPKALQRMVPIPNCNGLASFNVTIAESMKAAGYATGIFGKWHLDEKDGAPPEKQGFDTVFESYNAWRKKIPEDPKGIYSLTRAAGDFMEKNKDRPFFLYLPFYAIHAQLQSRPETLTTFKQSAGGKASYAACTYDMDDGIGLVLAKLKELGLEKNTIVIFTSDNGATPESPQEPLRGNKGCYYEGGIREPFIVRWPGVINPGTHCDVPVISQDFYPTALDVAGAAAPKDAVLDGVSLVSLLKGGDKLSREAIFWHFPGYLDKPVIRGRDPVFRTRPVSVIRKGDWKLFLYHEEWLLDGGREKIATNNAVELYNIADDIGERRNLALKDTAKRDELLDGLLDWMQSTHAKMPTETNPAYNPNAKATGKKGKKKNQDNEEPSDADH